MARHVRYRRAARAVACGGASRRDGAFALESERGRRAFVGDLASVCGAIFKSVAAPRTILNALFVFVSICGLWAGTVYVPSAVTILAEAAGSGGPAAAQLASRATMLVAFATIIGCLLVPRLARGLGRRGARALHFTLMV